MARLKPVAMDKIASHDAKAILLEKLEYFIARNKPDPAKGALTDLMEEQYYRIESYADYGVLGQEMERAMTDHGLCTWDIEEFSQQSEPWKKREGMVIGTMNGVYDIDLAALKAESKTEDVEDPDWRDVLPATLVRVLEDRMVIKLGSGIAVDAFKEMSFGLHVQGLICTQELAKLAAEEHSPSRGQFPGDKTGFGRIATDVYGHSYKPNETVFPVPKAWQHSWRIYSWRKPLTPFARFYRYMDGILPLVYLCWLLRRAVCQGLLPDHVFQYTSSRVLCALAAPAECEGEHKRSRSNKLGPVSVRVGRGELFSAVCGLPVVVRDEAEAQGSRRVEFIDNVEEAIEVSVGRNSVTLQPRRSGKSNDYAITGEDIDNA